MSSLPQLVFFDNDVEVVLEFTLKNPDGSVRNLTGDTITMEVEAATTRDKAGSFACTIVDGPNGRCDRTVAAGDFSAGTYFAQIKDVKGTITLHSEAFMLQVGRAVVGV